MVRKKVVCFKDGKQLFGKQLYGFKESYRHSKAPQNRSHSKAMSADSERSLEASGGLQSVIKYFTQSELLTFRKFLGKHGFLSGNLIWKSRMFRMCDLKY